MAWMSNIFNVKFNLYIQWSALVLCLFQSLWHHFCGLWHNAYTISHIDSRVIVTVVHGLAVIFAQSIEAGCQVRNEDVVGAVLTGNVPSTSECSTILLPKVWLILVVWWQGKNRSSILKLIFGMIKKHTFPSFPPLISFHPLGKYIQDGTMQETSYDVCGMYYISTDLCTFMAFPQHHLPHINLGGIISFSVMLGVCLCHLNHGPIPLRCQRSSYLKLGGPGGPNLVWDPIYVRKHLADFCTNNI